MVDKTSWTQELWIRKHLNTEQNPHTDMNQIIKLTSDGSLGSFMGLTPPVVVTPGQSRRTYLARNFMNAQTPPGPPALTCLHVCSTGLHGNHKSAIVLDWMKEVGSVGRWQMNVSASARLWSKSRCSNDCVIITFTRTPIFTIKVMFFCYLSCDESLGGVSTTPTEETPDSPGLMEIKTSLTSNEDVTWRTEARGGCHQLLTRSEGKRTLKMDPEREKDERKSIKWR